MRDDFSQQDINYLRVAFKVDATREFLRGFLNAAASCKNDWKTEKEKTLVLLLVDLELAIAIQKTHTGNQVQDYVPTLTTKDEFTKRCRLPESKKLENWLSEVTRLHDALLPKIYKAALEVANQEESMVKKHWCAAVGFLLGGIIGSQATQKRGKVASNAATVFGASMGAIAGNYLPKMFQSKNGTKSFQSQVHDALTTYNIEYFIKKISDMTERHTTKLNTLDGNITARDESIKGLGTEIDKLDAKIQSQNALIGETGQKVKSLMDTIVVHKRTINSAQNDKQLLRNQIKEHKANAERAKTIIDSALEEKDAKITELEAKISRDQERRKLYLEESPASNKRIRPTTSPPRQRRASMISMTSTVFRATRNFGAFAGEDRTSQLKKAQRRLKRLMPKEDGKRFKCIEAICKLIENFKDHSGLKTLLLELVRGNNNSENSDPIVGRWLGHQRGLDKKIRRALENYKILPSLNPKKDLPIAEQKQYYHLIARLYELNVFFPQSRENYTEFKNLRSSLPSTTSGQDVRPENGAAL